MQRTHAAEHVRLVRAAAVFIRAGIEAPKVDDSAQHALVRTACGPEKLAHLFGAGRVEREDLKPVRPLTPLKAVAREGDSASQATLRECARERFADVAAVSQNQPAPRALALRPCRFGKGFDLPADFVEAVVGDGLRARGLASLALQSQPLDLGHDSARLVEELYVAFE